MGLIDVFITKAGRDFRFFGSPAKLVNLWRLFARRMYTTWSSMHGARSAGQHARRMPPRCLAGRWGSVIATEIAIDDAGDELLGRVLRKVLQTRPSASARSAGNANDQDEVDGGRSEPFVVVVACLRLCPCISLWFAIPHNR